MPAVGSSRNRTAGWWARVAANASRRCMPPEIWSTRLPSWPASSTRSSTSRSRRRRCRRPMPYSEALKLRFSHTVSAGNWIGSWGRYPTLRRWRVLSVVGSRPRRKARPSVGR